MKKLTILFPMLVILGLLVSCGSNADAASDANQTGSASQQGSDTTQEGAPQGDFDPENMNFEVPLQTVLLIGTFELEDTENAVTAEQAAELLPLWMVLKNLLESDTAATEEIDALTNQIADTMTDSQMTLINELEIDPQSSKMLLTELGLAEDFPPPESADGEESQRGANRPEGMPEGMGPGMGPGGGDGAGAAGIEVSPEQMETMQATREAGGGPMGNRMGMMGSTELIEALIELLQSK